MTRTAIFFFLTILIASLLSSFIGGLFAMAIGWMSPEFVSGLFGQSLSPIFGPLP
jgi:hypothetical protein